MKTYTKHVPLDTETSWHFVRMGRLNTIHGPSPKYPFPTERGALAFAQAHKDIARNEHGVERRICIYYPDGREVSV